MALKFSGNHLKTLVAAKFRQSLEFSGSVVLVAVHNLRRGCSGKVNSFFLSRDTCSRRVTHFLIKAQHLPSPGLKFRVLLNHGCHVGFTNDFHMKEDLLTIS